METDTPKVGEYTIDRHKYENVQQPCIASIIIQLRKVYCDFMREAARGNNEYGGVISDQDTDRFINQYNAMTSIMTRTMAKIIESEVNDASKIAWAKKISDKFGLAAELPSVVNAGTTNPVLHAASDLLKERNVGISAQAFNRMLELKGVVRKATRPGRFGNTHKWFVINPDYDRFGQNQQDPKYQQQTQARWYDNLFDELLGIVGISKQAIIDLK